jgi:hypothetical protein
MAMVAGSFFIALWLGPGISGIEVSSDSKAPERLQSDLWMIFFLIRRAQTNTKVLVRGGRKQSIVKKYGIIACQISAISTSLLECLAQNKAKLARTSY